MGITGEIVDGMANVREMQITTQKIPTVQNRMVYGIVMKKSKRMVNIILIFLPGLVNIFLIWEMESLMNPQNIIPIMIVMVNMI